MYQFIISLGSNPWPLGALRCSLLAVGEELASLGPSTVRAGSFGDGLGTYAVLEPAVEPPLPLIQQSEHSERAVLFWGRLDDFDPQPCERVSEAYARGGARAVAALNGCYSAVVVDRVSRSVHVVGDSIGLRCLRYSVQPGKLLLASHALPIEALLADDELDLASVASILSCDWSLGNHSLNRGLEVTRSHQFLRFQHDELSVHELPILGVEERLDAGDQRAIRETIDGVIGAFQGSTRALVEHCSEPPLRVSVTAGVDSRAAFGLLLSEAGASGLLSVTRGGARSLDVAGGRALSKLCGVRHRVPKPESPNAEQLLDNCRTLAIATDGTSDAKRMLDTIERPGFEVTAGGSGGEILRGFYYNAWNATWQRRPGVLGGAVSAEQLAATLGRRLTARLASLPEVSSLGDQLGVRLLNRLSTFEAWSANVADQLDLLYTLERYAVWSSTPWRQSWRDPWSFVSPRALRLAFSLPAPIAGHRIVEQVIRRTLPRLAYYLPANGSDLLPLRGPGIARHGARTVAKRVHRVKDRLLPRPPETPDDQRARVLTSEHVRLLDELVASPTSVAAALLGPKGARALVERNVKQGRLWPFGGLITMETYRRCVRRARRRVAELSPSMFGSVEPS